MVKRLALIICVFFLSYGIGWADEQEIRDIQAAIDAAGADWVAGDNWIMQLPKSERNFLGGGLEPPNAMSGNQRLIRKYVPPEETNDQSYFDWRNQNGYNWLTPIRNQRQCGSCVAFACIGTLEADLKIAEKNPNLAVDLSEQHLFSCGGGSCASGWYPGDACNYLQNYGVPDEACLPYTQSDSNCSSTCSDWTSRVTKIASWSWVTQGQPDVASLKAALTTKPIFCRMDIYEDFMSYSGGVYVHVTGAPKGGHYIVLIGWNDSENSWICKNSWGEGWGENGFFRIRRDQVNIGCWAGNMVTQSSAPATCTVEVKMPSTFYHAGDNCYCDVSVATGQTVSGNPLVVILDVYGSYYFAPSWVNSMYGYDYYSQTFNPPGGTVSVIPAFSWPEGTGSASGIKFYAAITNPSLSQLYSNLSTFTFGWDAPGPSSTATPPTSAAMPRFATKGIQQATTD